MSTIAIVGSRVWLDAALIETFVDFLPSGTVVLSGGARGVDGLALDCALDRGLGTRELMPDYPRHGRRAPLIRNEQIAAECDGMMAFWDGKSRGTMHAVGCARKLGKPVWIWE